MTLAQRWADDLRISAAVGETDGRSAYDVVWGLTATQYLLAGNGLTVWATVVRNEEEQVLYVVVEAFAFGPATAAVLNGHDAEQVADWLDRLEV